MEMEWCKRGENDDGEYKSMSNRTPTAHHVLTCGSLQLRGAVISGHWQVLGWTEYVAAV